MKGIDISNHQGLINWAQVAEAGYEFAIIKSSQGINFTDAWFERNWKESKANGLVRGAYHFMEPYNNPDARAEADHFYKVVTERGGIEEGDILVLDAETTHSQYDGDYGDWCLYWLQIVQSYFEFPPMCYTSPGYIQRLSLNNQELAGYPIWLASWVVNHGTAHVGMIPAAPAPWSRRAELWQYTDKGRVPGIATNVDLNLFDGTIEELKALGKTKKEPQPQPPIDVEAIKARLDSIEHYSDDVVGLTRDIVNLNYAINAEVKEIYKLLGGTDTPT